METRRRKRAEASSAASAPPPPPPQSSSTSTASRSSKRSRTTPVTTRSRAAAAAMDGRRSSGRGSDKGKEKETDASRARDRAREIEKRLGLNADGGGDELDGEDRDGGSVLSTSSALQGLLRKLGAGFDDFLPGSVMAGTSSQQSGKLKKILSGLRADGEEGKQMDALSQLCEMLSIGTEDSLASFAVDSFVPVLVGLLNHENNPDIMLLAARALTHLCDVLPSSCASVVHYGGVSCFCSRLLTIEYMDLAEQSLQALNKISQEHPTACLRAGALMAVLSYLDFFSTGVQRVALSTAANMCKRLPSDAADFVMEAVPLLTNLLRYHDSKVLEHASVCLTRITEAFASSSDKLDELCNHGLVAQVAGLISTGNSSGGQLSLSTPTYTGLIRLLSTCARGSALGAKTLHLLGISGVLKDILSGAGLVTNVTVSPSLTRPPEQVFEIVNLANELLPPLPQGTISLPTCFNGFIKGSAIAKSTTDTSGHPENANNSYDSSTHEKLMQDQPELLRQFGMDLLPILIQIYGSSINGPIRHKCLSVIAKLMYFSTAEMIQSLLSTTNISSFLAGILAWKDPEILIPALQIADILMEKLPGVFCKMFVREGVVHAVDALILTESSEVISVQSLSVVKDNDSKNGSSRSRRHRRRGASSSIDGNPVEESVHGTITIGVQSGTSDTLTPDSGLRASVSSCAKAFKEKYFSSESGGAEIGVSEDLIRLKNLCAKLSSTNEYAKSKSKGKSKAFGVLSFNTTAEAEEHLNGVVFEIMSELSKEDSVSTFEFIGSGAVSALLNYLSCGMFLKEKISEADLPKLCEQAIKRYKLFVATALPVSIKQGNKVPMTVLVRKLQNALSSLERFPVVLSRSSGGNSRISSGLSALYQPVKLRLSRADDDKSLRDYSSNVVLIDPLASLAAVEEFLWPRIQRTDSEHKLSASTRSSEQDITTTVSAASLRTSVLPSGHRPSTRSRSAMTIETVGRNDSSEPDNSAKRKGKAVLKASPDETKGPQTRNAARRKAASDKDLQTKPDHGNSIYEEDLDFSPTDVDDALMIREDNDMSEDEEDDQELLRDDSLPACPPEKVHDVNLGDMTDDDIVTSSTINNLTQPSSGPSAAASGSTEGRGVSFSSRGVMSFAAAAMSGLASVSGRGIGVRDRHGFPVGQSSKGPPKLTFSSGGKLLNRHLTIYQAIQQQLMFEEDHDDRQSNTSFLPTDGSRLWSDIYTINYQKADNELEHSLLEGSTSSPLPKTERSVLSSVPSDVQMQHMPILDSILKELPSDLEKNVDTRNILLLMRILKVLNQVSPRLRFQAISDDFAEGKISNYETLSASGVRVPLEEFVNSKLTPKLARQMQDGLALCGGSLPSWCYQLTKACPFLFNFETRRQYFYSTAFGLSRALHRLQQQQVTESHGSLNEREVRIGRLRRQKVRVSRKRILESAAKVMEMYSSQKAVLEVEYFGEVGTGLGPTLEFYTLVSHELQKVSLHMWRSNHIPHKSEAQIDNIEGIDTVSDISKSKKLRQGNGDLIHAPFGLFPRPWPPNADCTDGSKFSKVVEHFRLAGRIIAKALQDGRLLDLPLSVAFYKLMLGQELDLHDILYFDAEFGRTLQEMQVLVSRKHFLEKTHVKDQKMIAGLNFHGIAIQDLCLDFTLPGYPDYVLKTGEESTMVDIYNLEEYITLVVDATVRIGIARQMEAFRAGFNQVFDITSLQIFSPDELDYLLCGRRELWEAETLVDHIKFDHGYTAKSPAVINLLEIMGDFTQDQQRAFCQFVTGSPSLPLGGLAALNPKLTIVRKHSSSSSNMASNLSGVSDSADEDLPSVMTCANYLKLPAYSTKEIMYKKLLYAINEGQGSFDLS